MDNISPQVGASSRDEDRPKDISLCHARAMLQAAQRLQRLYEERLKPCGLRTTEYAMLSEIDEHGSITLGDMVERFTFDRSTLRYRLAPLVDRGLLAFSVDARDRRGRELSLTHEGQRVLAVARQLWLGAQDRFEAALGRGRAETIRDVLQSVASAEFREVFGQGASS